MSLNPLVQNPIGRSSAPPLWVAGSYNQGDQVTSPLNSSVYIKRVTGGGALDPSVDGTNWKSVNASRYITNPRELPIMQLTESNIYLKTSGTAMINISAANSPTFFSTLERKGAQATVAVADTFVTVTSLTGPGRLYNVIPPSNTGAPYRPTVEITVDGITYTITPTADLLASNRMIVGAASVGLPSINSAGAPIGSEVLLPNAGGDFGFVTASVGGVLTATTVGIVTPEMMESVGMPFLQFESSCVIRFKTNLLASSAGDRIGGATYRILS